MWLEEQCTQVEKGLQHNDSQSAFKVVKNPCRNFSPRHRNIHDELCNVLSELDDIKARWKRYTKSLYEDKDNVQHEDSSTAEDTGQSDKEQNMLILLDEVRDAIQQFPHGKAAGYHNLSIIRTTETRQQCHGASVLHSCGTKFWILASGLKIGNVRYFSQYLRLWVYRNARSIEQLH